MGEHPQFAGGPQESTITPIVVALILLGALLVLVLPRKYALAPILLAFLVPGPQQIYLLGLHWYIWRIVILAGVIRMLWAKFAKQGTLLDSGFTNFDKLFCFWALLQAPIFLLRNRDFMAVPSEAGFCFDLCGQYFLARYLIRDREDVFRVSKILVFVATVTAACMAYEHLTGHNAFDPLRGFTLVPWVRNGRVRAQGVFQNSITAGTFGATLFPLFFCLWKCSKAKMLGVVGLVAATIITLTSVAGTPATTFVAVIVALCMWPIRRHMRAVRWGLVLAVLGLALVMKAPIWYAIARVDVIVGAHGWDRAFLLDQFSRHFSDWWLLGATDNGNWGLFTWDACNEFAAQGIGGGLISLVLFIMVLSRGFSMIGRARKAVEGDRREEWFYWSIGVLLFSHVMSFWGIDYFDKIKLWWYICLAIFPAATAPYLVKSATQPARQSEVQAAAAPWVSPFATDSHESESSYFNDKEGQVP